MDRFVVKRADPCTAPYMVGYVEDAGDSVTLNLGRDGREADVVVLADREKFQEDQAAYREEVAEAQADYKKALAEYPAALREWEAADAQAQRRRSDNRAERSDVARRWDSQVDGIAHMCGSRAPAASPTAGTAAN